MAAAVPRGSRRKCVPSIHSSPAQIGTAANGNAATATAPKIARSGLGFTNEPAAMPTSDPTSGRRAATTAPPAATAPITTVEVRTRGALGSGVALLAVDARGGKVGAGARVAVSTPRKSKPSIRSVCLAAAALARHYALVQTAPRLHLRCAACGKLSKPEAFTGDHELEALVQSFVGGGRRKGESHGFSWERQALGPDQAELIRDALHSGEKRIAEILGGAGTEKSLDAMSEAQLKRLHLEAIEREAAIAKALGVPPLGEQIDPPSVAKLRKQKERDRETIRLSADYIAELEKENAALRDALDDDADD